MNTGKTLFIIIYDQYNLLLLIRINRLCLFPVIIILYYIILFQFWGYDRLNIPHDSILYLVHYWKFSVFSIPLILLFILVVMKLAPANYIVFGDVIRDEAILLFFLPIFLSGNSFFSSLLCSIFCSKL